MKTMIFNDPLFYPDFIGKSTELSADYSIYPIKMNHNFFKNYVYIIVDHKTQQTLLIDPAWDLNLIQAKLTELKITTVNKILITHSHYDHLNLVKSFQKIYQSEVFMHIKEIEDSEFNCAGLIPVNHLDSIKLGDTEITVLHTPGHTKGSACYLLTHSIFTGDTVFIEGCGLCSNYKAAEAMYQSIQLIKKMTRPEIKVFPGHSYGKNVGEVFHYLLLNNIYFNLNDKEMFINFRLRKNQINLFKFM